MYYNTWYIISLNIAHLEIGITALCISKTVTRHWSIHRSSHKKRLIPFNAGSTRAPKSTRATVCAAQLHGRNVVQINERRRRKTWNRKKETRERSGVAQLPFRDTLSGYKSIILARMLEKIVLDEGTIYSSQR